MPGQGRRDEFSQFEFDGWERVARRYESAWQALTTQFVPPLLEAARVVAGSRLLDVACGPGYVAEGARKLGAEALGIDFSPEMIGLAKSRNPVIPFRVGDAQALEFDDGSFDAVVMNFGIFHLSRPDLALVEARRVLRPGGSLAFTVWAAPGRSPGARIVEDAIRAHANLDLELPKGPDYFGFGDAESCRKTLGAFGYDPGSLVFRTVTADWQVPSAAFVFEAERDAGVRTAAVLAVQTPEAQAAIRAQMEREFRPYARDGGYSVPYAAHVIAAQ